MKTNREKAVILLNKLINNGISDQSLLEFLINDYMDGNDAYQALLAAENEFFEQDEDEIEDNFNHKSNNID
jgi:hypothetical protein